MGRRRQHLFVLLFMLGLVIVSGLVVVNKPTKLGLDLKGGVELVYQGTPTGQVQTVSSEDIERSIEIIRQRIDKLGVAEPEVSRLGQTEIAVSLPDVTNAQRAIDQVGTTAQLYFYDLEPNLVGREVAIAGNPAREPPAGPFEEANKEWKAAGRSPSKQQNRELILRGAFPTAYAAVQLASEQKPEPDCTECSTNRPRYYLFKADKDHELLAGPEFSKEDLYITVTGKKRKHDGVVMTVPPGTVVVSEVPEGEDDDAEAGWFVLKDRPALSGTDIENPKQEFDQLNQPNITFSLTDHGREAYQELTRKGAQRGQARVIGSVSPNEALSISGHTVIVLDNEVKSRLGIDFTENPDGIDGRTGIEIQGNFTTQEAQDLATFLQIGALPINLKLISQTQVSATLGTQALHAGIKAGLIGLILVIVFLLLFYRLLGLVASLALGAYGVIFFALIKLIPITLTLPGIAGLVLTIGVAADSNIVIFERIKEEVRAGRPMASAISTGYRRGIATIIDANVITLLTAFILFVLATAGVKGFAFTLGVGTIVSLLTAVVFTRALLGTMSRSPILRSPSALGGTKQRLRWHFDFMGASRWFFSLSGAILIIGALALATQQLNFGIDFESGTRIKVALEDKTDEEGVRDTLDAAGIDGEEIQQVSDPELGDNVFQIQTRQLGPNKVEEAQGALDEEYGVAEKGFDSTSVGPTFGRQIASSALKALIFSLLVICAYVAFRFDPKFAVPVLIAVFHDILITAGIYSLTGREVTSGTVAAFLTILGYSLYDTVIVFDRIRENMPRMPRAAFSQIVNRSMSEVLTRSLVTSFSTLLGVVSLLIFGGATLKDFAFAMLVGIASGTYSSIFIASPVLTAWKEREPGFADRRYRLTGPDGTIPAFADEIEVAKLGEETEAGKPDEDVVTADAQRRTGVVATAEADGSDGAEADDGAGTASGEESPDAVDPAVAERREKDARRRARRQQRRKHGRNR